MRVSSGPVGKFGVNSAVSGSFLPLGVWSYARNVVFRNGKASFNLSKTLIHTTTVSDVNGVFPVLSQAAPPFETSFLIFTAPSGVYTFHAGVETNVSRAGGYTSSVSTWNGSFFNGIFILTGPFGAVTPQVMMPIAPTQQFINLPNWPVLDKCAIIRPFKNFLVALDHLDGSTFFYHPRKVRWSHPADPGTVPISWDVTDPTKDAGEVVLPEGQTRLVDCAPLGDANVLYTQDSAFLMQLTGDSNIFSFTHIFSNMGAAGPNCVVPFRRLHGGPPLHFVVGIDEIVVHDGQESQNLTAGRLVWRIDPNAQRIVTAIRRSTHEIIVGVTGIYGTELDQILCWNWESDTWSFILGDSEAVPSFISSILRRPNSPDYDILDGIVFSTLDGQLWHPEFAGIDWGATPSLPTLIRYDIAVTGTSKSGEPIVDPIRIKKWKGIWFHITNAGSTLFSLYALAYDTFGDGQTVLANYLQGAGTPIATIGGGTTYVPLDIEGRFLTIAIFQTTVSTNLWSFESYELEVEPLGEF